MKCVMGIDLLIPIQGYQELHKALELMERAAQGPERVTVAPSTGHKHTEEPCPRSWQSEQGMNPNPCASGVLVVGIPRRGSSAGCPGALSRAGKGGSSSHGQGGAELGLCKEKGPGSLSACPPLLPAPPSCSPYKISCLGIAV